MQKPSRGTNSTIMKVSFVVPVFEILHFVIHSNRIKKWGHRHLQRGHGIVFNKWKRLNFL